MKEHWEYIAAVMAILMTAWGQLKTWSTWAKGLVVRTAWIDMNTMSAIAAFLSVGKDRLATVPVYGTVTEYVRPMERYAHVAREFRSLGSRRQWYRRWPVWLSRDKDAPNQEYMFKIVYLRGTIDVERLIVEATDWANRTKANDFEYSVTRHMVTYHHGASLGEELAEQKSGKRQTETRYGSAYRFLGWKSSDIGARIHARNLTSLSLPPNLQRLAELVGKWMRSKDWYKNRGIPHRRGFLLHGKPGTGKTSFVRALGEEHDLPIHVMDLATLNNSELRKAWNSSAKDAPCIILIEDIDAVFHGRENVAASGDGLMAASGGLTFDSLLNCIDGIERHDGVILAVTTNHLEFVDEALTDRPGRIDHIVEFLPLGREERYSIAKRILEDPVAARELADSEADVTAASFVETCCRKALELLYNEREVELAGQAPGPELRREVGR